MIYRPIFYWSNKPLGLAIHQVPQIMQAAKLIFKMATDKLRFAYKVDLWPATPAIITPRTSKSGVVVFRGPTSLIFYMLSRKELVSTVHFRHYSMAAN